MSELTGKNDVEMKFSLKKIPLTEKKNDVFQNEDKKYLDKVRLLELSNFIDEWEKELLFSENGFFSLKGKQVENKASEYILELEKFINSKLSKINFFIENSKRAALEIKRIKIENIKKQLDQYEQKELYEWEISVYNDSIQSAHNKAVLYKDNPEIVIKSINNGISVISIMAEREHWKKNILERKKEKFIANCCFDIIKSFLDERNINFPAYYNTYSKYLSEEQKFEIEKTIEEIKLNILGYNWAVELFSYNLTSEENDNKIKELCDPQFESVVSSYINILEKVKKDKELYKNKQEIDKNWENIIDLLDKEPEKSLLYVDFTKEKNIVKAQKEYIKKIIKNGFIDTDKSIFIELFEKMLDDFNSFKKEILSKQRHVLSDIDYKFFENIQKLPDIEYLKVSTDYKYLLNRLTVEKIVDPEKKYLFILDYRLALKEYKELNSKEPDLNERNKIIEFISEKYTKQNMQRSKK